MVALPASEVALDRVALSVAKPGLRDLNERFSCILILVDRTLVNVFLQQIRISTS
jgi:hypothetical protein